jgi:hypothetical protein
VSINNATYISVKKIIVSNKLINCLN